MDSIDPATPGPDNYRIGSAPPLHVFETIARLRDTLPAPRPHPARRDIPLSLEPRHAIAYGTLRGAEAAPRSNVPLTPWSPSETWPAPNTAPHLTASLIDSACREAKIWDSTDAIFPADALSRLKISLDISESALATNELVPQTLAALDRSGLSPDLLELEFPEHILLSAAPEILFALTTLHDFGIGLAIDNFGRTANSLQKLHRLPLTTIKLDSSLIQDLTHDRDSRALTSAAIAFAHAAGLTVVAMGLATPAQRDILADLNCDEAQGPLFARPLPAASFRSALIRNPWDD